MSGREKWPSILALDLGTTFGHAYCKLGIEGSYREDEIEVGSMRLATPAEITDFGKTRMNRRLDPRIPRFYDWLELKFRLASVDVVVFEDVQFSSYTYQVQLWSSLRAALWVAAYKHGVTAECLPVGSLKKFAGAGSLKKAGMAKAAVTSRFSPHPKGLLDNKTNTVLDDNAVDALHLWKWAFQNLRRTPVK